VILRRKDWVLGLAGIVAFLLIAEVLITILLVTHDIDESVYVGDRVVVLTPGPGRVRADLPVDLPAPRDQISTRELPAFVHLQASVGRLVRGHEPARADERRGR
jgi:ABC-type nitrate/sulfonate/bicarbonate transport system ATPase subunit